MQPFLSSTAQAETALFSSGLALTTTWIFSSFWECRMLWPLDVSCFSSESLPSCGIFGSERLLSNPESESPTPVPSPSGCSSSAGRTCGAAGPPSFRADEASSEPRPAPNLPDCPPDAKASFAPKLDLMFSMPRPFSSSSFFTSFSTSFLILFSGLP